MNSFNELAENVRIYLRIRPKSQNDSSSNSNSSCLALDPQNPTQAVTLFNGPKAEIFTYDSVGGPETSQETIFETVARPVTDYCLQGYNGTIFAYGQTGSGKTFTMQGPMTDANLIDYNQRGLIPRTFEYLFECIRAEEEASAASSEAREFLCKCSYVEIYNETIFDLLDVSGGTCTLREDIKRGVYIEGAREEIITSPSEAYEVYERGSLNRHVAETSMNRESSRSHSVFTLFIQSKMRVGEIVDVRESRFNLVDLAGSERQQMTGTTGQRLKEAGNINKSLLALGNVINGLVDISHGRARHVQYRDSKLTFLLRDSLGGNAKTVIIANVSPSPLYFNETLSTLKFAQRAKMIKNKAVVNKDIQGNVLQLQAEIQRLQHELYLSRHNPTMMLADSAKKPRIDGGASDELDAAEAYLMLTLALERQAEASDEIESFRSKLHLLEELVKRKEAQNQSLRMILKFRENSLKSPPPESSEVVQDLRDEIQELRKIIEHHPEVTRFAYENLQLREKLYKFEGNQKRLEEFEAILQRHKQYEQLLTNRLLILEKRNENDKQQEGVSTVAGDSEMMMENDNVPMRNIIGDSNEKNNNDDEYGSYNNFSSSNNNNTDNNRNIQELKERIVNLEGECEKLKSEIFESSSTASNYRQDIENLWESNSKLESNLKEERANNEKLSEKLKLTESELTKAENELKRVEVELERVEAELKRVESEYKIISNDYNHVKSEYNHVNTEYNRVNDELNILKNEYNRVNNELDTLKNEHDRVINEFDRLKKESEYIKSTLEEEKGELKGVLEVERESLSRLMQEREELQGRFEAQQRQLEREKDQSRTVLQDYEVAKSDFSRRIQELNEEIEKQREEFETAAQKVKSAQAERTLLQQELEVTRQILAEYKASASNNNQNSLQAAEEAGRRISQLESESIALKEQIQILQLQAQTATSLADRNKILQAENGQLHGKIGKLEFLMRSAQSDNDELMAQVTQLQKHLETSLAQKNDQDNNNPTSPYSNNNNNSVMSSQLDAANHTIVTLKRQLTTLEGEIQELRGENDRLNQNQNLKQKLQYHLKMKQENADLQDQLNRCRDELTTLRSKQQEMVAFLNEMKQVSVTQKGAEKVIQMIKNMNNN